MIPNIIHYCWYGGNNKSSTILMCIDSWKKFCPDFVLKEWNEDNTPMDIKWVKESYKHKKYAFVADYVRFYALYTEGGIYLDTDMLLTKPLDDFLNEEMFIGREDANNANMAIVGASKGFHFCSEIMSWYDAIQFDLVHPPIITRFISPKIVKYGFREVNETQRLINGVTIFRSDYFYPIHYSQQFNIEDVMKYTTADSYAVHLWNKSWSDEFSYFDEGKYKQAIFEVLKRVRRTPILPIAYWKKVFKYVGRYFGLWNH